jgi:hypothetical protein
MSPFEVMTLERRPMNLVPVRGQRSPDGQERFATRWAAMDVWGDMPRGIQEVSLEMAMKAVTTRSGMKSPGAVRSPLSDLAPSKPT